MKLFALFLCLVSFSAPAKDLNPRDYAEQVEKDLEAGKLNEMTLNAIEAALHVAAAELRDLGHNAYAEEILSDWYYREKGFILSGLSSKEMGDHDPVEWLFSVWKKLDKLIGTEAMVFMHLDDLWIFATSLKVVIRCQDHVDKDEYARHFVGYETNAVKLFKGGFAGALTYWVAMLACSAAASQPWSVLCSPVASLAEAAVWLWVAPPLSPKVWKQVCNAI